MNEGPYKKQIITNQKEVCTYCKYCRAHKVYKQKSVDVLSAECRHPKVVDYCPSAGTVLCNDLNHDDTDVFTPYWCPVKIETSNYGKWIDEMKKLADEGQITLDTISHNDVLIFLFLEGKTTENALLEYQEFQRRYLAIKKSKGTLSKS